MDLLLIIIIIIIYGITRIPKILMSVPKNDRKPSVWNEEQRNQNAYDPQKNTPVSIRDESNSKGLTKAEYVKKKNVVETSTRLEKTKNTIKTDQLQKQVLNGIVWSEILSPPKSKQQMKKR